jgi:23S rRNA (cytidine1920-2'-O)/16S rRNA (cytidine1409-2'-O)-methyltransferase
MAGEVLVEGQPATKAGMAVPIDALIELTASMPYVGRGGFKLAAALAEFGIEIAGRTCADVGACTGGFTDVMLQHSARCVYAIDVGYGQLDWKLRQDERVVVMERTNARYLNALAEPVQFVAIDVSFISLRLILPAVQQWLAEEAELIALIKPQFEAGREQVGKGGIVRNPAVHRQVLAEILAWCQNGGLGPQGLIRSPIEGSDGNIEFLLWLKPGRPQLLNVSEAIDRLLAQGPS